MVPVFHITNANTVRRFPSLCYNITAENFFSQSLFSHLPLLLTRSSTLESSFQRLTTPTKACFTIIAVKSQSALLQNHNNPTSYLLHKPHVTPIRNTYSATFAMQDSSSEPPSDSSSPDLRHNSIPNATQRSSKMIKVCAIYQHFLFTLLTVT